MQIFYHRQKKPFWEVWQNFVRFVAMKMDTNLWLVKRRTIDFKVWVKKVRAGVGKLRKEAIKVFATSKVNLDLQENSASVQANTKVATTNFAIINVTVGGVVLLKVLPEGKIVGVVNWNAKAMIKAV